MIVKMKITKKMIDIIQKKKLFKNMIENQIDLIDQSEIILTLQIKIVMIKFILDSNREKINKNVDILGEKRFEYIPNSKLNFIISIIIIFR